MRTSKSPRPPRGLGKPEVEAFLSHLTTARNMAVGTQNQVLDALGFLYREVLPQPFDQLGVVARPLRRAWLAMPGASGLRPLERRF